MKTIKGQNRINQQKMKKETKTIRLIYPQWQGANIVKLITEVENPNDASRGYFLGAQLLNFWPRTMVKKH